MGMKGCEWVTLMVKVDLNFRFRWKNLNWWKFNEIEERQVSKVFEGIKLNVEQSHSKVWDQTGTRCEEASSWFDGNLMVDYRESIVKDWFVHGICWPIQRVSGLQPLGSHIICEIWCVNLNWLRSPEMVWHKQQLATVAADRDQMGSSVRDSLTVLGGWATWLDINVRWVDRKT